MSNPSSESGSGGPVLRLDSLAVHGGQSPEPTTGAIMPPVSLASTYVQSSPGVHRGYEYSRSHNPTRYALERCIASLEGADVQADATAGGFAFASGLAAIGTALELLDAGDRLLAVDDLYGGTNRLFSQVRARSQGLDVAYVEMTDDEALDDALTPETRMVWIETPTNPTLKVVDLRSVVDRARARRDDVIVVCDNTFATPMLQRPLECGCDIVMHSATKYLGGHSDVVGGILVTNRPDLAERIRFLQNAVGSVLGPLDSYLVLRGLKTLSVRMERHCRTARRIAAWLEEHPKVNRVVWPGLDSHPQAEAVARQMSWLGSPHGVEEPPPPAGGGMITIWLDGDLEASRAFLERLRVFALAESLGGVESLVDHPAIMTHASVPAEMRARLGIDDNLCRLSVGVEHVDDLLEDLEHALTVL